MITSENRSHVDRSELGVKMKTTERCRSAATFVGDADVGRFSNATLA